MKAMVAVLVLALVVAGLCETEAQEAWLPKMQENKFVWPSPKIVNGNPTTGNAFPFMAALHIAGCGREWFFCGGSLIRNSAPLMVITAAHCAYAVEGLRNTVSQNTGCPLADVKFRVYLGRTDINNPRETGYYVRNVASYRIHPDYAGTVSLGSDVALLAIEGDTVPLSPVQLNVDPNGAAPSVVCCSDGEQVRAVGYGRTDDSSPLSDTLQYVDLDYVECGYTGVVCAYRAGYDICFGDSGGPLLKTAADGQYRLAGVMSFVVGGCNAGHPSGFTDLMEYSEWIDSSFREMVCQRGGDCSATVYQTAPPTPSPVASSPGKQGGTSSTSCTCAPNKPRYTDECAGYHREEDCSRYPSRRLHCSWIC
jgi:elastase-1